MPKIQGVQQAKDSPKQASLEGRELKERGFRIINYLVTIQILTTVLWKVTV